MKGIALSVGHEPIINEDGWAAEAITPGHLLEGVTVLFRHNGGVQVSRAYALERDELGNNITVAYAIDDTVKVGVFSPGQRVYAFLASGENVAEDEALESDGDGCLQGYTAGPTVARALEDVNAAAGTTRIRVEVV